MKKKQTKTTNVLPLFMLAWLVAVFVYIGAGHVLDAEARIRCTELQDQAAEYDLFRMADWERDMCDSVGVNVNVRYSDEMLAAMDAARTEAAADQYVSFADPQEIPAWYEAQQNARYAESAYLNLRPELKKICACESVGRPDAIPQHYEADGKTVLTGRVTPADKGMCQINLDYHEETSKKLGLDIHEPHDNVAYANWLYKQLGSQPWNASRKCWGKALSFNQ